MANIALDTFTDTNGTNLTAHTGEGGVTWSLHPTSSVQAAINSNRVYLNTSTSTALSIIKMDTTLPGDDHEVSVNLTRLSDNNNSQVGLVVRLHATDASYYSVVYNTNGDDLELYRVTTGTETLLGKWEFVGSTTMGRVTPSTGKLTLRAKGTLITAYWNDTQVLAIDDGTHTTGDVGLRFYGAASTSTGLHVDDVSVDENPDPIDVGTWDPTKTIMATTDTHVGWGLSTRYDAWQSGVNDLDGEFAVHVFMGDLVEDSGGNAAALTALSGFTTPPMLIAGNHDMWGQTIGDWETVFTASKAWTHDMPGTDIRIIGISSRTDNLPSVIHQDEIDYILTQADTEKKVVLLLHCPLYPTHGLIWRGSTERSTPIETLVDAITARPSIIMLISGHVHMPAMDREALVWLPLNDNRNLLCVTPGPIGYTYPKPSAAQTIGQSLIGVLITIEDDHVEIRTRDLYSNEWLSRQNRPIWVQGINMYDPDDYGHGSGSGPAAPRTTVRTAVIT